jgi:RNA polymerase sigma factor (sigma-70 family)
MTCSPSQPADLLNASDERARIRSRAQTLLDAHGVAVESIPGTAGCTDAVRLAATATALMDVYRRTGSAEVFECLVQLTTPQLFARVRSRLRFLGAQFDPYEVLQDTIINIYRYPDRFDAARAGAFAAWSSTIVDNTIRRQLRRLRTGVEVALSPTEVLSQQADVHMREPALQAQDQEECRVTANAFSLVLALYLAAYQMLSERERFVLQMVEVRQMRYAELAQILGIRPEALKMVVFRARKRVFERLDGLLAASRRMRTVAGDGPNDGHPTDPTSARMALAC